MTSTCDNIFAMFTSFLSLKLTSTSAAISSKTRIRWTQDLHEKFVECVNRLGGAESKQFDKGFVKIFKKKEIHRFLTISLMIDCRGNAKDNTEVDGLRWIDHFSREKSSPEIPNCKIHARLNRSEFTTACTLLA
ncbi:uncharacterized protein LOC132187299 [Corylus avellana]|uniref:uncharacterized protein LOC132187299 n=1 Tax=Corylus avellana TaxID=13451 RepID=UPI00286BCD1C|nr:uncharacterized protein LOC132187299 [Corylus avellana]XP_059457562.1 uncharacterized protein LOC132187299 [Corylus avellana]